MFLAATVVFKSYRINQPFSQQAIFGSLLFIYIARVEFLMLHLLIPEQVKCLIFQLLKNADHDFVKVEPPILHGSVPPVVKDKSS